MDGVDKGRLLSLVLDSVDPRLTGDQRGDAFEEAASMDALTALSATCGVAYGLLLFVREELGLDVLDDVMQQLASSSISLRDDLS